MPSRFDRLIEDATELPWVLHNDSYAIDRIQSAESRKEVIGAEAEDVDGTGYKMPYPVFSEEDASFIVTLANHSEHFKRLWETVDALVETEDLGCAPDVMDAVEALRDLFGRTER